MLEVPPRAQEDHAHELQALVPRHQVLEDVPGALEGEDQDLVEARGLRQVPHDGVPVVDVREEHGPPFAQAGRGSPIADELAAGLVVREAGGVQHQGPDHAMRQRA
eukprot:523408-Lingulodinium_polyedra.AAC.1